MTLIVTARERRNQSLLFFYFGVALLALSSRSPDLKRNLGVDNGTYGVLLSLGAIGAVIAFMFVGQLVHRIGVELILFVTGTFVYGSMALMPHIRTSWIFVIANIVFAASFNAYNIALHDQALKRQLLSGEKLSLVCMERGVLALFSQLYLQFRLLHMYLWLGISMS